MTAKGFLGWRLGLGITAGALACPVHTVPVHRCGVGQHASTVFFRLVYRS